MTPQNTTFWETRTKDDEHKDWHYEGDWIGGYEQSVDHPHRAKIIELLHSLAPFDSLLEIGCSVGPNLKLIREAFPHVQTAGIDPNEDSVEAAHDFVPGAGVIVGDMRNLSSLFPMKSVDVVLADASLMYMEPEEIGWVMDALTLTVKKAVVIVERCTDSKKGTVAGGVWGRDYETLLSERGFKVTKEKITEELWPGSPNWAKYGWFLVGTK